MAGRRITSSVRRQRPEFETAGSLRLTRDGDRLEPAHLSVAFPSRPVESDRESDSPALVAPDATDMSRDLIVIANRARLEALHQLRSRQPVDVSDAFAGWFWVMFVFIAIGAAINVLLGLRIAWAAGVGFGVDLIGLFAFTGALEHHERKLIQQAERGIVDVAPRAAFHWRLLTPPYILRRARGHLDALNVDDSELEDRLDALVRPGCDSYDLRPTDQQLGRSTSRRCASSTHRSSEEQQES